MMRVCVFLGASSNAAPHLIALARDFGARIATSGNAVVYGGCSTGMMGALADGALRAGGEVIGVLPRTLKHREPGHAGLTRLEWVTDLSMRKIRMTALADAFVALPGGYGTLDELFEVLTDRVVGLHQKPVAVLDTSGYYASLLMFLRGAVDAGLLAPAELSRLAVHSEPGRVLQHLVEAVDYAHSCALGDP